MSIKVFNSRRGTWTWGDLLYFIVFYIPMTLIVTVLLVSVPSNILDARIITGELDNVFLGERIFNKVSFKDIGAGRIYPGVMEDRERFNVSLLKDAFFFPEDRNFAVKLSMDSRSVFYNEPFYEIARPLAPVRYKLFVSQKEMIIQKDKSQARLTIEQVFDKKNA